jgi:hypothetical protein
MLSLVPIVGLGFILARVLQAQIVTRTLADASQSAALIARIGVQPRLSPDDLRNGLSVTEGSPRRSRLCCAETPSQRTSSY